MGMAKKRYSKVANIEPSVLRLTFQYQMEANSAPSFYVDLSQVASIVNRRFYRQGINWAVSGFKFLNTASVSGGVKTPFEGSITISKLPNTWVMSNAWTKAFKAWQKMNREALAETESVRPKFLDFKIYADDEHHTAGFGANLMPISAQGTAAVPGEWIPSKIHVPFGPASPGNTTELEFKAVGSNYNGAVAPVVSLIEGYAASRGLPNVVDPNTPGDSDDADGSTPENWMSALFNTGTDQTSEVIEDMTLENNIAPYPFENDGVHTDTMYPNGANQMDGLEVHDIEAVTVTTIGATTRMNGGNFPCGLIKFTFGNNTDVLQFGTFFIDLVPGTHRGYLCEPMLEM